MPDGGRDGKSIREDPERRLMAGNYGTTQFFTTEETTEYHGYGKRILLIGSLWVVYLRVPPSVKIRGK